MWPGARMETLLYASPKTCSRGVAITASPRNFGFRKTSSFSERTAHRFLNGPHPNFVHRAAWLRRNDLQTVTWRRPKTMNAVAINSNRGSLCRNREMKNAVVECEHEFRFL